MASIDKSKFDNRLRIIWTIALKDIGDALQNKTILSVILGVVIMMLTNQLLPLLLDLSDVRAVLVLDPGESQLVQELDSSDLVSVQRFESQEELELGLTSGRGDYLGLVLPPDIDQAISGSARIQLDGYLPHWTGNNDAAELEGFFEQQLTTLAGIPVDIVTEDHGVYPLPDSTGPTFMVSMYLVLMTIIVCGSAVPYLMIEEKETHTLDALLVSPASYGEVVIGKALAGTLFGIVANAVVLAFHHAVVVHWGLAFLAVVSGTLFAVAMGLLMGTLFNNPQQLGMWMALVMMILLVPVFLSMTMSYAWPEFIRFIFRHIPSSALAAVFRISLAGPVPIDAVLSNLSNVIISAVILLAVVVWLVRRMDR